MQDPLSFFIAGRDGSRQPVAPVPDAQIKQWVTETEIAPASGASRRGGKHRIMLGAADDGVAATLAGKLRSEGYPARVRAFRADGELRYVVDISGLGSAEDAVQMAGTLRKAGYTTLN